MTEANSTRTLQGRRGARPKIGYAAPEQRVNAARRQGRERGGRNSLGERPARVFTRPISARSTQTPQFFFFQISALYTIICIKHKRRTRIILYTINNNLLSIFVGNASGNFEFREILYKSIFFFVNTKRKYSIKKLYVNKKKTTENNYFIYIHIYIYFKMYTYYDQGRI